MLTSVIPALILSLFFSHVHPAQPDARKLQKPKTSGSSVKACDFSQYKPLRITTEGECIKQAGTPEYPEDARRRRIAGRVGVRVLMDPDGVVQRACAISGPQELREAAEQAALKTVFHPVLLNGEKLRRYIEETLIVQFKLTAE